MTQEEGEGIDTFTTRLRKQASRCDFQDADRKIKFQIIQGCLSSSFRKVCLRDQLNLNRMLEHARSAEAASQYEQSIEKPSKTANAVKQANMRRSYNKQQQASSNQKKNQCRSCGGDWPHRASPCPGRRSSCRNCGLKYPHPDSKPCPAAGRSCASCGKLNHFAQVCRSKANQANHTRNVRAEKQGPDVASSDESVLSVNFRNEESRPFTTVKFGRPQVRVMIDTGLSCNLINMETLMKIHPKPMLKSTSTLIHAYGNKPLNIRGKFSILITSKHTSVEATVYVTGESRVENLLSYKTAEALELVKVVNTMTINYEKLKLEFPSLFSGIGKMKNYAVKLHIDESIQPVTQKHRRVDFHLRKAISEEIEKLLAEDIIEAVSEGPTPWVSPCIAVPKPKQPGKLRMCVDMRAPNKAILRTRHVMPTIEDLVVDLNGATVFSKLDMNQGYHQLELEPTSRFITIFATHRGLFRYKRLHFGINCAAEIFDDAIRQTISGIPGVVNRSDDILVTGRDRSEHDKNLRQVLTRLQDRDLTLNFDNCEFGKKKITYFHYISVPKVYPPTHLKFPLSTWQMRQQHQKK